MAPKQNKMMDLLERLLRKGGLRKRKTVLFAPLDSVGHINSLISIANALRSQGHRTVFLFMDPIANKLKEQGHEVYDATTADLSESKSEDVAEDKWSEVIQACRETWKTGNVIGNLEQECEKGFGVMIEDIKKYNPNVEKKLALIKPDVLIVDHYFGVPALFKDGLPWVRIFSASPLSLHNEPDLPQAWLGLPTQWNKEDPGQRDWNERAVKAKKRLYDQYNAYWKTFDNFQDLPLDPIGFIPVSSHLNVYMYPEELDYGAEFPLEAWKRCDCMVRDCKAKKFELPASLRDKPGKLIFLSLGSLASADFELMKRLTGLLADCKHKFIVCKGPMHANYELPDNMWGDKFVPQLEVLNSIDLIITHGGNNTITESFYYGVPGFIVCPLFGDQFDNAQRLEEKGLGLRLDPYNCTKEQLHEAIESMLSKEDVRGRMQKISERMRKPEARGRGIQLVSEFVNKLQ